MLISRKFKYFVFLLWIAGISLLYYRLYPFLELFRGFPRPQHLVPPVMIPVYACFLFFLVVAANGFGGFFWKNLYLSFMERFLFATAAGFGIMAFLVLLGNAFSIARLPFFIALLALGILLYVYWAHNIAASRDYRRSAWKAAIFAAIPLSGTVIGAMAPPTQFDSLVYHLALPVRYLAGGKIFAVPHSLFFSFPQNAEMLFQMALGIHGDILANAVAWSFYPLTGMALYSFSRRVWNARFALLTAALWLFTPAAMFLATGTYVDIMLTFYVFLGFYSLVLWHYTNDDRWAIFAGLMCGFAAGVKYTGLLPCALLALLMLAMKRKARPVLLFSLTAGMTFLPWLVKNAVLLRNPAAPWGTGVFTHSLVTADVAAGYLRHIHSHGTHVKTVIDALLLPWTLTVEGYRFGGAYDLLGPLFLLFIPGLFLTRKIDTIRKIIIAFTVLFIVVWFFNGMVIRFLLPVLPFLCCMAALGFSYIYRSNRFVRAAAMLFLLAAALHNLLLFHWTLASADPYAPVLSGESRSAYLVRKLNYYMITENGVNLLPKDSSVLFFGETRSYYAPPQCTVPTVFDRHPLVEEANRSSSPDELARSLRAKGFTHLMVNDYEARRLGIETAFTPLGRKNTDALRDSRALLLVRDRYCALYELPESKDIR